MTAKTAEHYVPDTIHGVPYANTIITPSSVNDDAMKMVPDIAWEWVTPAVARDMLSRNSMNRPIKTGLVSKLAESMLQNNWVFTGANNIVIGKSINGECGGTLLNGQHTLSAIMESGKTLLLQVARHREDSPLTNRAIFGMLDTESRSLSDAIYIAGYKSYYKQLTLLLKSIRSYETKTLQNKASGYTFTNDEIVSYASTKDMKALEKVAEQAMVYGIEKNRSLKLLTAQRWLLLTHVFAHVERGTEFLVAVSEGTYDKTKTQCPINYLIRRLYAFREFDKGTGEAGIALRYRIIFDSYRMFVEGNHKDLSAHSDAKFLYYPKDYPYSS